MARFFTSRNNGVVAVIREDDAKTFGLISQSGGDPTKVGVRVFTFCDLERLADPWERRIFTGHHRFLKDLENSGRHEFIQNTSSSGWGGVVPFSNQEHRQNPDAPGGTTEWQRWVTTLEDAAEKFELLK